jgi:hypothetical protein
MLIIMAVMFLLLLMLPALVVTLERPQGQGDDGGNGNEYRNVIQLDHGRSSPEVVKGLILTALAPLHNHPHAATKKTAPWGGLKSV